VLRKNDILIVLVFIIIASSIALAYHFSASSGNETGNIAVISMDGKVIKTINLDTLTEPIKIEINGRYSQVIYAEQGRICFGESECPYKSCVKMGWISKRGSTAVCLPNRVIIKIEGTSDETDGVVY
jgi:hypothetical protein